MVIEQGFGANAMDTVMVDVSTLRSADAAEVLSMSTVLHATSKLCCCRLPMVATTGFGQNVHLEQPLVEI